MLAVGLVVVITVAVAFAVVYRATDTQLNSQLNQQILSSESELAHAVRAGSGASPAVVLQRARTYIASQPYSSAAVLLYAIAPGRGTVSNHPELVTTGDPDHAETHAEQAEENAQAERIRALPPGFHTACDSDDGALRIYTTRVRVSADDWITVGAAEPLAGTHRALIGVAKSFAVAGGFALLLTIGFAYLIGTRITAPLRQTARVVADIDAGDLTPRLSPPANTSSELLTLTDAFNRMLDRLGTAFDTQRDFIADASHELRTPITVIRGQLDLLAVASEDAAAHRGEPVSPMELLRVERLIQAEIARITRLTDDLLLLAQSEQANFLRRQPVELRSFITDLWDGLTLTADRRFEIGPIPAMTIDADPDRLAQALRNLGRNAINHSEAPTGLVRIAATTEHGVVQITVSDDGPGIPEPQRERVFERFYRTDPARTRALGGAGLGLSIVQAIVHAHGGRVRVAPSAVGAAFEITLPITRGPSSASRD